MILNGNQRGGGLKLAAHLMNVVENDHVEVHELRGFCSQTLRGALQETDAVAKGTQCKQYLFSLSLSPPETERVPIAEFGAAVAEVEKKLGLVGQPRAIVFHEKNGRRHAHAVWSRIDVNKMEAINLPFYHNRLTELSKDLFLQHDWRLPDGLRDRENRNPTNFNLAEWQQAKRAGKDARAVKRVLQEAWQVSDTAAAFAHALEEKGYYVARGDRRGYVAIDVAGDVYAIPKWVGVKTRQVREKLGDAKHYRSVDETKAVIALQMQSAVSKWEEDLGRRKKALTKQWAEDKAKLKDRQRAERDRLMQRQTARQVESARKRQSRFRQGLSGLWDRLRGEHTRIRRENQRDAWQASQRDQTQRDEVIFRHLEERKLLKRDIDLDRASLNDQAQGLELDRARFEALRRPDDRSTQRGLDLQK
ncbi:relaxase/mobilization nuclease domain-containing protein [uncultured Roseobacter sp.]|uniref:relaxase/mobilization nuclease domain-containing protein n=1 Tax=uncultured Roseobacter sp. TaxID=114847 RepID=UPI002602892F|nr:relaxase/mobilization nuclease domain-containing protein [uncultured Roseobacter sp.]